MGIVMFYPCLFCPSDNVWRSRRDYVQVTLFIPDVSSCDEAYSTYGGRKGWDSIPGQTDNQSMLVSHYATQPEKLNWNNKCTYRYTMALSQNSSVIKHLINLINAGYISTVLQYH